MFFFDLERKKNRIYGKNTFLQHGETIFLLICEKKRKDGIFLSMWKKDFSIPFAFFNFLKMIDV